MNENDIRVVAASQKVPQNVCSELDSRRWPRQSLVSRGPAHETACAAADNGQLISFRKSIHESPVGTALDDEDELAHVTLSTVYSFHSGGASESQAGRARQWLLAKFPLATPGAELSSDGGDRARTHGGIYELLRGAAPRERASVHLRSASEPQREAVVLQQAQHSGCESAGLSRLHQ